MTSVCPNNEHDKFVSCIMNMKACILMKGKCIMPQPRALRDNAIS